jgi:hypothetical protein
MNMSIEIIGRDPILTYKITQMIGARAERAAARRRRIDMLMAPIRLARRLLCL